MRVYLDDDLGSDALIAFLSHAAHQVYSPRALETRGAADEEHLDYAAAHEMVLLTANAEDFIDLHHQWMAQHREHHGILIVYRENNRARDMSFRQIAEALSNVEQSGVPLANAFHNLNFWRQQRLFH